ncbi:unnamed protein product [Thelazia callipaeda]|uniref:Uncharacterized protein n=1 Tax=Thelazia callipaeda TaxID=103827 RepID=A0A0N5CZ85_THECL|nr:unnamed protein product [Thelazia callipaeda]
MHTKRRINHLRNCFFSPVQCLLPLNSSRWRANMRIYTDYSTLILIRAKKFFTLWLTRF